MSWQELFKRDGPLGQSKVIGGTSSEFRERIWSIAIPVVLKKGQSLFMQDDFGDAMYVIENGSIEISVLGSNGKKLSLNVMRAPDVFGEIAALDGGQRTASATAREETHLKKIPRSKMLDIVFENPQFSSEMFLILCERIRWISQQVEDLVLISLEDRLARRLQILHIRFSDTEGYLRFSQMELADFLGTTRETINKILQNWQSRGLINVSRGKLQIIEHSYFSSFTDNQQNN